MMHDNIYEAISIISKRSIQINSDIRAKDQVFEIGAEYGCYLFDHACKPLIKSYVDQLPKNIIGHSFVENSTINNKELIEVNLKISSHSIEKIGKTLRKSMTS